MVDVSRFNYAELVKMKDLFEQSRYDLQKSCRGRTHCDGCAYNHLCVLIRDLIIIASKETKARKD